MQVKLIVSAAGLALVAGLASASAAEQFTTLDGISADVMSASELDATSGLHSVLHTQVPGRDTFTTLPFQGAHGNFAPASGPQGIAQAERKTSKIDLE